MVEVKTFVKKTEILDYNFQNVAFKLEVNEHIFPPSKHGSLLVENIQINPEENVIDIGTGSGIIAIFSAKNGAKVFATDTDKYAVETTKRNAQLNNVNIECYQGNFFAGLNKKFDVIVANLPQEIVPEDYKKAIGKQLSLSLDGGKDGNNILLEFLNIAKNYMHKKTRLYVVVYSVSDYKTTFKKIIQNYNAKLIAFDIRPTKEFVESNEDLFLKLNNEGKVYLFKKDNKWMAEIYFFELSLKEEK